MFKVALTTCCDLKPHTDVLNGTNILVDSQSSPSTGKDCRYGEKKDCFLLNMTTFNATYPASVSLANTSEDLRVVNSSGQVELLLSYFSLQGNELGIIVKAFVYESECCNKTQHLVNG